MDAKTEDQEKIQNAICEHWGLGENKYPIGEEWLKSVGYNSRQYFNKKYNDFIEKVNLINVPEIELLANEIMKHDAIFIQDVLDGLQSKVGKIVYFRKLFDMMKDNLHLLIEYDLYTSEFKKATKNTNLNEIMAIKICQVEHYKKMYKKLIKYSNNNGICDLDNVIGMVGVDEKKYVLKLLSNSKQVCLINKSGYWYIFENDNNLIYHTLGKMLNLVTFLPKEYVINAMRRTFSERKREIEKPSYEVLDEYLKKSTYVKENEMGQVYINVEKNKLSNIENKIIMKLNKDESYTYDELKSLLLKENEKEGTIIKAVYHSPILFYEKVDLDGTYKVISKDIMSKRAFISEDYLLLQDELAEIIEINKEYKKYTSAIIKIRLGQGKFRDELIKNRQCKCELCNISQKEMLIASHIKEFSISKPEEAMDINNGLLLCANHDKLFDKHLISFKSNGEIIISKKIERKIYADLAINEHSKINIYNERENYMIIHRSKLE